MSILLHCLPLLALGAAAEPHLLTYPAPAGETPSADWTVRVRLAGATEWRSVFVQRVATLNGTDATFGSFDFAGRVEVEVTSAKPLASLVVRPLSYGIRPALAEGRATFSLDAPRQMTFEANGAIDHALHLFANPPEAEAPKADDPNVLYFGPGLHDLGPTRLRDGQTVYLAPGAIVRPTIPPDEKPTTLKDWSGVPNWVNLFESHGVKNLTIRGRGVLDMSKLPWHARTAFVLADCENLLVEGITILDAPAWVVACFGCRQVTIRGIKQICSRQNSDGIDLCNTQDALVEDCWLRNNDDEICVKTTSPSPAQESRRIVVQRCVVWNERARGLGITSETRRDISDVTFRDCDVIHDFSAGGDCASLAVLVSDSGTMRNIRFEDIRVEQVRHTLVNLWIGADMWGHDPQRGRVDGVVFRDVSVVGADRPRIVANGCDPAHLVENVTFERLSLGGQVVATPEAAHLSHNEHTRNIRIIGAEPAPR